MRVGLETEESKINNFIDVKMNVIMIQPSLSSLTKTDWILTRTGSWVQYKILSFKPSVEPCALVHCEMPAESLAQAFYFHKIVTIDTLRGDPQLRCHG